MDTSHNRVQPPVIHFYLPYNELNFLETLALDAACNPLNEMGCRESEVQILSLRPFLYADAGDRVATHGSRPGWIGLGGSLVSMRILATSLALLERVSSVLRGERLLDSRDRKFTPPTLRHSPRLSQRFTYADRAAVL